MQDRTNQEIIRIVKLWQESGHVHELTCRLDSTHATLIPFERDGKVLLGCPTCGTAQDLLPKFVLESESWLEVLNQRALETIRLKELERDQRTGEKLWSYGSAIIGGGLLGMLIDDSLGAAIGAAVGLIAARLANRKR